jgi:hypothetical protein
MLISIRHHLNLVHRAPHALRALIQHMGVDYGGLYIPVTEQFLHGLNIVATLDQTSCKEMLVVRRPLGHGPGIAQPDSKGLIWSEPPA